MLSRIEPDQGGGQPAAPRRLGVAVSRPWKGMVFLAFLFLALLSVPFPAAAAGSASVPVSAVILSVSNCRFRTGSTALNFGFLDPANPVDVTVGATIGFRCNGGPQNVTFAITRDDGLYRSGPGAPRLRHNVLATEFLPYGLGLSPVSGTVPRNTNQILAVTGTVLGASYGNAASGAYSDTVTLTILP